MNARQVAVEAVKAADEFFARRLWRRLGNEQVVGIALADSPPIAASVMGAGGQEFGLSLLIGERAVEEMLAIGLRGLGYDHLESHAVWVSLTRRVDIEPPYDRALVEARRQGRMVPLILSKAAEMVPQPPRRADYETMIFAARALLVADDAGRLEPGDPGVSGRLLTLQVSGDLRRPDVATSLETIATVAGADSGPGSQRSDVAVLDVGYGVALTPLPVEIDGSPAPHALVVMDLADDRLLMCAVVGEDPIRAACDELLALLRHGNDEVPAGRPARMVVTDAELHRELRARGVDCELEPDHPVSATAVELLRELLQAPPDEADALDFWKTVDRVATEALMACGGRAAMRNDKAWRRYLGADHAERDALLDVFEDSLLTGYVDWYIHHHRGSKRARTIAERVLADEEVPADVRSMVEARDRARLSFYRVESVEVGEGVTVRDLLSGSSCFVSDRSISMSADEGRVFPARVYPAGEFRFALPVGPSLPANTAIRAIEFLSSEHGLRLDDCVDPGGAHLLGRLWPWSRRLTPASIRLQNGDGHELRWHTARFSVADPQALAAALDAREDVRAAEPGVEWVWVREDVHLGRLESVGDQDLLLDVNSAERYLAARGWLERIPGVTFESVTEKNVDPRKETGALDDRLPELGPIDRAEDLPSPGAIRMLQRTIDERCIRWLDEPIPMLGGKTPRETCATKEGRKKVARLIRAYADPGGTPGIRIPRERMLAELGLGEVGDEGAG